MKPLRRFSASMTLELLVLSLVWLGVSTPLWAADAAASIGARASAPVLVQPGRGPQSFGTQDDSSKTFAIGEFDKPSNTVTWATTASTTTGIGLNQTSGGLIDWWQSVNIPNGAILNELELEACDTSATGSILFGLAAGASPAGAAANVTSIGDTGMGATPGCAFFSVFPVAPPLVADNADQNFWIFVAWNGDFTAANTVNAFRVYYKLQVSPAPAVATFPVDVPTSHPFFQFIEALADAGITAGTGAGQFSPDQAVTRGQMAVFLSIALGLHFPN